MTESPATRVEANRRDVVFMHRVVGGDELAFEHLLHAHWGPLVAFCDRVLRERDAAEDIAQETFVRLWEARAAWQPLGSFRAYLYRIARNLAFNELRRGKVRARAVQTLQRTAWSPTPADRLDELEQARAVTDAITRLSERRRQVFLLARYHDMSYAEIATVLEVSPQTVANHMSAALADLRRVLSHAASAGTAE